MYGIWARAMEAQGVSVKEWGQLEDSDKQAWEAVEDHVLTQCRLAEGKADER